MPTVVTFTVDPPVIAPGETALMTWDVADADTVYISPAPGQVATSGAVVVNPGVSTYYTLVAQNSYGSTSASAVVSVYPYAYYGYPTPNPVIIPFSGQEEELNEFPNQGFNEERNERGKRMPMVKPPVPPVTTPTPSTPTPPPPAGGQDNGGKLPRLESFTSSPSNITMGKSSQLQWRTNGASTVDISPNIGTVPPSGTLTVTPTHTTNYKITVSNSAGVVQHTQEVTVPRMIKPNGQ
jgi:hypothetical protein